jgi:cytoskeletal protein CcmA (bactofilin family)
MRFPRAIVASTLILLPAVLVLAQDAGENVVRQGAITEDLYLAGGTVEVRGQVEGDVVAAGGTVRVSETVRGDVLVAGGSVEVAATVSDDVRAAGGEVEVGGTIGDHLAAAGGTVRLAPAASVGGRAFLAGSTVRIDGKIGGNLRAAGESIVIRGEIGGDAELAGERIEIAPGAVIRGQLRYASRNEARIDSGATIGGAITRTELEPGAPPRGPAAAAARFGFLTLLAVAAIVLALLLPRFSLAAARGLREAPWKSLALGLAVFATGPVVIVLLFATVIGTFVALPLMALLPVLLLAGFLTAMISLSDYGLQRLGRAEGAGQGLRALAIAAAFLALWLLCFVPGLGPLLLLVLLWFGVGALSLSLWQRYRATA